MYGEVEVFRGRGGTEALRHPGVVRDPVELVRPWAVQLHEVEAREAVLAVEAYEVGVLVLRPILAIRRHRDEISIRCKVVTVGRLGCLDKGDGARGGETTLLREDGGSGSAALFEDPSTHRHSGRPGRRGGGGTVRRLP